MKRKFWRENFYVTFPIPCSYFLEKSREFPGNPEELFPGHFEIGTTLIILYRNLFSLNILFIAS